jgi:hypothetical protein
MTFNPFYRRRTQPNRLACSLDLDLRMIPRMDDWMIQLPGSIYLFDDDFLCMLAHD